MNFPKFEDITVSTKTIIADTNIEINMENLLNFLEITNYVLIPKKRGRKKKVETEDPNKDIKDGSIISLKLRNLSRGVDFRKNNKKNNSQFFRNSITIVMVMDNKMINIKVSRNGKFQMTGCKQDSQAEKCILQLWKYIKDSQGIYNFKEGQNTENKFIVTLIPAMRNIDFNIGFILDREKIDLFFNTSTQYRSLLETSIGYTGVNIKIPIKKSITELDLRRIYYNSDIDNWSEENSISYGDYVLSLPKKERDKKLKKERYTTFLVFHSGKIICSSLSAEFCKETYEEFLDIFSKNQEIFKEKIETTNEL